MAPSDEQVKRLEKRAFELFEMRQVIDQRLGHIMQDNVDHLPTNRGQPGSVMRLTISIPRGALQRLRPSSVIAAPIPHATAVTGAYQLK